ncbi:MAG: hypothetical protein ACOVT5_12090, partial [Armatimonadaceae bacterium]
MSVQDASKRCNDASRWPNRFRSIARPEWVTEVSRRFNCFSPSRPGAVASTFAPASVMPKLRDRSIVSSVWAKLAFAKADANRTT